MPALSYALCGLNEAVLEQIGSVKDPEAARAWSQRFEQGGGASCVVCHVAGRSGPRTEYGNAINVLLTGADRFSPARKLEAGRRVNDIPADPALPDSPTFGDLIAQGFFPAPLAGADLPQGRKIPAKPSENVTVERARELVQKAGAESDVFKILQLSRTYELSPEAAGALAEFRGEMLILGLKSLSPEVAQALAKSQANTLWLHSVTSVSPEAAEIIARLPGKLLMTGLAKLDSVALAEKLASRPGTLSLPYLKQIKPEIAAALGRNERGLALTGLADIPPEVQDKLAEAVGYLALPNLRSLDSMPLTRKLASAGTIFLPRVERLSVEQAKLIAATKRPLILGNLLSLAAMTPEVATVFAENPFGNALALAGLGPISATAFETLVKSPWYLELTDVEAISPKQVRILDDALKGGKVRPPGQSFFGGKFSAPKLKKLDSALLAETLFRIGSRFDSVTEISPEAARALGGLKGDYRLSFPSLEELAPETAELMMRRSWEDISLPALRNVSLETVRSLVKQTSVLKLGISSMPPKLAPVFGELKGAPFFGGRRPEHPEDYLGGGGLSFPYLNDLSPEAASILVKSLTRGNYKDGRTKSPQLSFGRNDSDASSSPRLTPELAAELAKYQGGLGLNGPREISPESAAALSAYSGPMLGLGLKVLDSPAAAQALVRSKTQEVALYSLRAATREVLEILKSSKVRMPDDSRQPNFIFIVR